jgi:hypothetical protein
MSKKLLVTLLLVIALTVFVGVLAVRSRREERADARALSVAAPNQTARPALAPSLPAPRPRAQPSGPPGAARRALEPPDPAAARGAGAGLSRADEAALMEKLRSLAGSDPQQILRLAREANAKDPDSPGAAERAWMVVKSLVDLQRFSEAKDEAQTMVNRYPGTSWALDVQRHLLSNPL